MSTEHLRYRIVPLVVACPLFLQNLDTSVMTTALPAMARSLHVQVLDLNLAITSYLLSLAIFLPASAWLSGRFGARRVFCAAVFLFSLGSAFCGVASTLQQLVACRVLQGVGGAMMVPVGRSILLRTVPPSHMVRAMVWFTIPGAVGRLAGPLFGGAIVTLTSWQWIFLVNIPFGVVGVAMALWLIEADAPPERGGRAPFDFIGLALLAAGFGGVLGGLETVGKGLLPPPAIAAMVLGGLLALHAYARRSAGMAHPLLDFRVLSHPTFRVALLGGFPIRVAIGAAPFLLPLMLQIGFALSPLQSGLLTMGLAIGSLATRAAMGRAIQAVGFRKLLMLSGVLAAGFYASYGLFTPRTPHALMFCVFVLGGLCTSMTMVSLNTLGYADIPPERSGHATAMAAMGQQLSLAVGVVLGAGLVSAASVLHGGSPQRLHPADFPPAFAAVALLALASAWAFRRLRPEDGEELSRKEEAVG
jgi:EmrB/QacA subfamily drug resistance transporter